MTNFCLLIQNEICAFYSPLNSNGIEEMKSTNRKKIHRAKVIKFNWKKKSYSGQEDSSKCLTAIFLKATLKICDYTYKSMTYFILIYYIYTIYNGYYIIIYIT